jgi:myo-inositol-1(or 4)-monophosphatase
VTDVDLDGLLSLAVAAAADAAALLVDGMRLARTDIATKSTLTDMVTEIDRASEHLIVGRLLEARPGDGVLAEEGSSVPSESGVRWVIDPLDGTTNYLYGHPGFAVSIAAEIDGRSAVAVVHDPLHGDVFTAVAGRGAHRNGDPIVVGDPVDLPAALVATGFSYADTRRAAQARVLTDVLPRIRDIRRVGAASVDLCWVACGRVDAFYERGLAPWDHAAGALVAAEAGATVADLDGGPPSAAFVLAARPGLFEPLREVLITAGAGDA